MAGAGAGLVSASPQRPVQPVGGLGGRLDDQGRKQVLDLLAGQRDEPRPCRPLGAFGQGGDHEEGVGEHRQGGPAIPRAPAADLMVVQTSKALASLEGLLDRPAPAGDPDQHGQRGGA